MRKRGSGKPVSATPFLVVGGTLAGQDISSGSSEKKQSQKKMPRTAPQAITYGPNNNRGNPLPASALQPYGPSAASRAQVALPANQGHACPYVQQQHLLQQQAQTNEAFAEMQQNNLLLQQQNNLLLQQTQNNESVQQNIQINEVDALARQEVAELQERLRLAELHAENTFAARAQSTGAAEAQAEAAFIQQQRQNANLTSELHRLQLQAESQQVNLSRTVAEAEAMLRSQHERAEVERQEAFIAGQQVSLKMVRNLRPV